jgi:RHS repeat-associated protein
MRSMGAAGCSGSPVEQTPEIGSFDLRSGAGKGRYLYDGHGRRVESRTTNYSVWQYSQSGQVMYSHDARNNRKTNYVYLGGSLVALREQPMSGGTTVTVKYQHTDALGTPVAVTDAAKAIVETFEYEPYGQLVNSTLKDGPGFTGHVQDAATGLTYMQQRYYDPQVGLFLSVDPVTAYSNPVGMFNRYRYANSNPYRFTDPDGRFACGSTAHCRDEIRGLEQRGIFPLQAKGNSSATAKIDCVECNEVKATRAGIMRDGGERLKDAGVYGAKEAAMMYGPAKLGKWLGGLGRLFRVSDDAARIAGGHAFSKHAKEFSSFGIRTERDFARHIDDVMANPTATRTLERGRTAFWDQRTGTVVIRDPSSVDGGTAFIPTRGIDYFNGLR